jgi:hypothetical protein
MLRFCNGSWLKHGIARYKRSTVPFFDVEPVFLELTHGPINEYSPRSLFSTIRNAAGRDSIRELGAGVLCMEVAEGCGSKSARDGLTSRAGCVGIRNRLEDSEILNDSRQRSDEL